MDMELMPLGLDNYQSLSYPFYKTSLYLTFLNVLVLRRVFSHTFRQ